MIGDLLHSCVNHSVPLECQIRLSCPLLGPNDRRVLTTYVVHCPLLVTCPQSCRPLGFPMFISPQASTRVSGSSFAPLASTNLRPIASSQSLHPTQVLPRPILYLHFQGMHSSRAISSRDDTMDPRSHLTSYVVSSSPLLQGAQTYVWVHLKRQCPAVVQEPGYSACFWPSQVICALYLAPPSTKPCDSGSQQTSTIGALDYAYIVRDDRILCELGGLSFPRIVQLPSAEPGANPCGIEPAIAAFPLCLKTMELNIAYCTARDLLHLLPSVSSISRLLGWLPCPNRCWNIRPFSPSYMEIYTVKQSVEPTEVPVGMTVSSQSLPEHIKRQQDERYTQIFVQSTRRLECQQAAQVKALAALKCGGWR